MEEDIKIISNMRQWPGETLCLKKKSQKKKIGMMGYSEFGIITNNKLPLVIYLRPNFVVERRYETIEAMLNDGWMVD